MRLTDPTYRRPTSFGNEACSTTSNSATFGSRLGLLTVCRQIHREAKTLPFELTTFYFDFLSDLPLFTAALTPLQRSAVRSMTLYIKLVLDIGTLTSIAIKSLSGLRSLGVFAQMGSYDIVRPRLLQGLLSFQHLDLEVVNVTFYEDMPVEPAPQPSKPTLSCAELREWSVGLEQKLLQGKAKGRLAKTKKEMDVTMEAEELRRADEEGPAVKRQKLD